jgi:hypothetical protein
MPRRNYDPAHGRPRPQEQRTDWTDLRNQMRRETDTQQTSGDQRRPAQKDTQR